MPYGLTIDGFVPKTFEEAVAEVQADLRADLGIGLRLDAKTRLGVVVNVFCGQIAELWELGEDIASSQNPDAATGSALAVLGLLTGSVINSATRSTVDLVLTGTAATVVDEGSIVSADSTDVEWQTTEDSPAFAELTAWAITTAYTLGQRRKNAGRSYQVITAGTSAGAGGPTTTDDDITDGTVHWTYLGEGTAVADVEAEAVDTGPVVGAARDIINIETPVAGWSSVMNLADAALGADAETDEDFRIRREAELAAAGNSPPDAIRNEVLDVDGVTTCRVFYNTTEVTDADGVPPHNVEVLIQGGDDDELFETLWDAVAAGIGTHGTEEGTVTDDEGTEHTVKFSRPTAVPIWVDIEATVDADTFPADGADQIKEIIETRGSEEQVGYNAVSSRIKSWVFGVTGVLDVTVAQIGTADPPTAETTITITSRQLATYAVARITVVTTPGTP